MNAIVMALLKEISEAVLKEVMTEENYSAYGDRLFDFFEDVIADSETKLDDRFLLPLVQQARKLTGIPDLPDVER